MRIHDDAAFCSLAEYLFQLHHRDCTRKDNILEHVAGAHGRKLAHIPYQNQGRLHWKGFEKVIHQYRIHHGGLVNDQNVRFQGVVLVPHKSAFSGGVFEQAMDGAAGKACGLAHALGGSARWCGKKDPASTLPVNFEHELDDGCLSRSRASGNHHHLLRHRGFHSLHLFGRKSEGEAPLYPFQSFVPIRAPEFLFRPEETLQGPGDAGFSHVIRLQVHSLAVRFKGFEFPVEILHDQPALKGESSHGPGNDLPLHLENFPAFLHKGFIGIIDMPLLGEPAEGMKDSCLRPGRGVFFKPHLLCDPVCREKSDSMDVGCEPIGVLRHNPESVFAVMAKDFCGVHGAYIMGLEENHQGTNFFLLPPGPFDRFNPLGPKAFHLAEVLYAMFDDVERLLTEAVHDPFSSNRPDPLDQARAQVLPDSLHSCREHSLKRKNLELSPELGVIDPMPLHFQHLAGSRGRQIPYNRHWISAPLYPHPSHCEARLLIGKGDAFDLPLHFNRLLLLRFLLKQIRHDGLRECCFAHQPYHQSKKGEKQNVLFSMLNMHKQNGLSMHFLINHNYLILYIINNHI